MLLPLELADWAFGEYASKSRILTICTSRLLMVFFCVISSAKLSISMLTRMGPCCTG